MSKPNNFPREGAHNPVTRDAVETLEAQRPTLNAELHYTIGGTVETFVHSNENAEREAAITVGSRRLHQSSQELRANFKEPSGDARSAYVREQKTLTDQWQNRPHVKTNNPTR